MGRATWSLVFVAALLAGCTSTLNIDSQPPGASIYLHDPNHGVNYVQDRFLGVTPLSHAPSDELTGRYDLRVELQGYQPVLRRIELPLTEDLDVDFALRADQ